MKIEKAIEKAIKTLKDILKNIDIDQFDEDQTAQIYKGLNQGLDVSRYSDPKYNWEQMREIRYGLETGVDVSRYSDPKYNWEQMREI
ncbi:MAG: hypothetical protein Q4B52_03815, partial [Tissierellia bacterium]|nr:hypothetical protein [Tissierellia bacterium]